MKMAILAGIITLSASNAIAQTNTAPDPRPPTAGIVEPVAPASSHAGSEVVKGKPANLCQELLAFIKSPTQQGTAVAGDRKHSPLKQDSTSQRAAPDEKGSSALAGTIHAGDGASAKPKNETNSAQDVTGQSGVATNAPEPSNDNAAAGSVQNAPQKESRPAPLPPADETSTPKGSVVTPEKVEELAAADDTAQCQKIARQMRVAGVAMPPPLIALAALDLQYQADKVSP